MNCVLLCEECPIDFIDISISPVIAVHMPITFTGVPAFMADAINALIEHYIEHGLVTHFGRITAHVWLLQQAAAEQQYNRTISESMHLMFLWEGISRGWMLSSGAFVLEMLAYWVFRCV